MPKQRKGVSNPYRIAGGPLKRSTPSGIVRTVDPSSVNANKRAAGYHKAQMNNPANSNKARIENAMMYANAKMGQIEGEARAAKEMADSRKVRDAAVNSTRTGFTKPTKMVDKEEYKKKSGRR